jgi:hypothetical protein
MVCKRCAVTRELVPEFRGHIPIAPFFRNCRMLARRAVEKELPPNRQSTFERHTSLGYHGSRGMNVRGKDVSRDWSVCGCIRRFVAFDSYELWANN